MNTNPGLIGKKLGNTQIFTEAGEVRRVTVIEAGPCVVIGKRTEDKDGYSALQLGFGEKREKLVNKPLAGLTKKAGLEKTPVVIREFRLEADAVAKYNVGDVVRPSDLFSEGQLVDVCGTSKGRGFSGVMRRHLMAGAATDTHGTHEYKRHGGSIGMRKTPGRTFKGHRMPGHYGAERVTITALRVVRVMNDENLVLVEGGVPGPRNGVVTVRTSVKRRGVQAS